MPATNREAAPAALELMDEAFQLLSEHWRVLLPTYLLGAVPFLLGFAHFCTDMSQSAFAGARLPLWSPLLAALFCWMRACQACFSRKVIELRHGAPKETPVGLGQALLQSAALAPAGLVLELAALVLVVPLGWVVAFNYHANVPGDQRESLAARIARAARQAASWPRQNHALLLLAGAMFLVTALNTVVLSSLLPSALRAVLGVESQLAQGGFSPLNGTVLLIGATTAYVVSDPLLRACYALRASHAGSRRDGQDLGQRLRRWRGAAAACLVVCVLPRAADAEPPGSEDELDRALDRVLAQPEFAWRSPPEEPAGAGVLARLAELFDQGLRVMGQLLSRLLEWLSPRAASAAGDADATWPAALVWLLLLLAVLLALLLVFRALRRHARESAPTAQLRDSDSQADELSPAALPAGAWRSRADELLERGESRAALRALYLCAVATLHERGLIVAASAKSVADYQRELGARAELHPDLPDAFARASRLFERAWYGNAAVDARYLADFLEPYRRVVTAASS